MYTCTHFNQSGVFNMATYTIGQMAKMLNKSQKTLREWDKKGVLAAKRTPSNRRFYTHDQYLKANNMDNYKKDGTGIDAIRGKVVLITGGTGSLGHALVERIADYAKKVIIYSRCELKQYNMSQKFFDKKNIRYLLGDIRDTERMTMALKGVDICIHAACMKRIDSCNYDPFESVKTNVVGSMNVIKACLVNKVSKAIMISTDKASSPATLYGGAKFVSEQMFTYGNNYSDVDRSTTFTGVRYGNIYGSNGSIKHIFERQLREKGKILVTHKEMTRFFMSLDNAVDLILYALNNCIGGDLFIPVMKAIKIVDFVKTFYPNVPIEFIGLRGHEKIHEELISETESRYVVKCDDKYYKIIPPAVNIPGVGWDLNYPDEKKMPPFRYSSDTSERLTGNELKKFDEQFEEKK